MQPVAHDERVAGSEQELLSGWTWEMDPVWGPRDAAEFGPFPTCAAPLPRIEAGLVEFDTTICGAYSVRARLGVEMRSGDLLEVTVAHSILSAPTPSSGRLALRVDDHEIWQWRREIPGPAYAESVRFRANQTIGPERWFGVHVSNHGANQWRIVKIRLLRTP